MYIRTMGLSITDMSCLFHEFIKRKEYLTSGDISGVWWELLPVHKDFKWLLIIIQTSLTCMPSQARLLQVCIYIVAEK